MAFAAPQQSIAVDTPYQIFAETYDDQGYVTSQALSAPTTLRRSSMTQPAISPDDPSLNHGDIDVSVLFGLNGRALRVSYNQVAQHQTYSYSPINSPAGGDGPTIEQHTYQPLYKITDDTPRMTLLFALGALMITLLYASRREIKRVRRLRTLIKQSVDSITINLASPYKSPFFWTPIALSATLGWIAMLIYQTEQISTATWYGVIILVTILVITASLLRARYISNEYNTVKNTRVGQ